MVGPEGGAIQAIHRQVRTCRFVDLWTRYINQLDAEITGRAVAKRTFDTSCVSRPPIRCFASIWFAAPGYSRMQGASDLQVGMGELRNPSSVDPAGWIALRPVSGAAAMVFFSAGGPRAVRNQVDLPGRSTGGHQ